jgi:hypothetical protein
MSFAGSAVTISAVPTTLPSCMSAISVAPLTTWLAVIR